MHIPKDADVHRAVFVFFLVIAEVNFPIPIFFNKVVIVE